MVARPGPAPRNTANFPSGDRSILVVVSRVPKAIASCSSVGWDCAPAQLPHAAATAAASNRFLLHAMIPPFRQAHSARELYQDKSAAWRWRGGLLAARPMSDRSPRPPLPEWAPHEAVWVGFPSDPELWLGDLKPAEREVAAFAEALHARGKGEKVWLVAAHEGAAETARRLAPSANVIVEPFGDIWLRDTGAIILGSGKDRRARGFGF